MILRLSSSAVRGAFILVTLFLAVLLSYYGIRNARATHFADLQTLRGAERAAQLEPGNPRNWYLLARYLHYNLEDPDTPHAILLYRKSLGFNPRSADTWLELAAAYEAEGNVAAARDAFINAQRVYPISADVSWRYGNFLLRQGERDAAFTLIRHAVEIDPLRAAEAFSRCIRAEPDTDKVLDRILPPSRDVYLAVIHDVTEDGQLDTALKIWDRLVALHPQLRLPDVFFLVDTLRQSQRIAESRRVWDQATDFAGLTEVARTAGSTIWDGGFESGITNGGYAWFLSRNYPGVDLHFDSEERHSGKQSLRVTFDGSTNLNFLDACQNVPVEPLTPYRFSAWLKTRALLTDEGVRFQLYPRGVSNPPIAATPELHGTQPWTRIEMPWKPPAQAHEVQICLARFPSDQAENKIRGTLWVDDVALVPESAEQSNP
jgi:tetratricopeptide (TPR) repeat protein